MIENNSGEARRQLVLDMIARDDAGRDETLNKFTELASRLLEISGSFISVLDEKQQYIKAAQCFALEQTLLEDALCRHTLASGTILVCPDTHKDALFRDHPLTLGAPFIRFYAGAPLRMRDGTLVGTLCVADVEPHDFSAEKIELLALLAEILTAWLDAWFHSGLRDIVTSLPNRQRLGRDLTHLQIVAPEVRHSLILIECLDLPRAYEIARFMGMTALESLQKDMVEMLRVRLHLSDREQLYCIAKGCFALLSPSPGPSWLTRTSEKLNSVRARLHEEITIDLKIHLAEVSFLPAQCLPVEVLRRGVSTLHEAIRQRQSCLTYNEESDKQRKLDFRLLHDLANALRGDGGLYLVYQPQLSLHSGLPVGMETLLRWQHPSLGNLPPMSFLPLVENTSLMGEVTDWVIVTALAQLQQWLTRGLRLPVSVNVSVSDLARPGFADWLERKMLRAGLPNELLRLECLETEQLLESQLAMDGLHQLTLRGFGLSLDDFGSGNSNINYLRRIPVDVIKLDRSLILQISSDAASLTIVRHVITMLKELKYVVLAEGVEDEETLLILRALGCDEIQGYFCCKPLPAEGVEQWLKGKRND